ncbi:chromosome partitioning protein ParA [Vibrio sp. MarTm2]|uniref:chromosome partitioning protein ParA n=1 Tax=Vibrio sp. MarTm2 TaxID=2998831 RepID=UPI0022CD67AF|nr:chromosome partitioning protein ParA [Vibrio sp. MarTm2]MDA0127814.1 chromosome partitioning protein ParA [Vibrio sp. MarTm2]
MKRILLISVPAILAGIVWVSVAGDENQEAPLPIALSSNKAENPSPNDVFASSVQSADEQPESKRKHSTSPTNGLAEVLNGTKGRALKGEIESFWHRCTTRNDCESQLTELESRLSNERFALIANYHRLNNEWQQSVGNLLFDDQQPLASRIALLKAEARKIWGELAEVIFADEFTLYDFSLQAEQLEQLGAAPAQDYVQAFDDLVKNWQGSEEALGLASEQAKYERAVTLIPNHISHSEREALVQALAQTYLTQQQSDDIQARKQQIVDQQQQVRDYQYELEQLKSTLEAQRSSSHAHMSESKWQSYYQQQIASFRRDFFAS